MVRHGTPIEQVRVGNLNHFIARIPQLGTNLLVLLHGLRVAMKMIAEPVEVDTYALIGLVMISSVDDIGCRGPDGPIQHQLLPTGAFLEARSQEKMA